MVSFHAVFIISCFVCSINCMSVVEVFEDGIGDIIPKQRPYNPDEFLKAPELIRRYGFKSETHTILTKDGYFLTLHRIPCNQNGKKGNQPVFIQHGLLSSSADFLDHGNKSLGFLLAETGYDVWLGNARGNSYSKSHASLDVNSNDFWDFSFHEMGIYDLPAVFEYISNETNQSILHIGHSMGTTMFFIYASLHSEEAMKLVKGMVALAPVAYMTHFTSPIRYFAPFSNDIEWLREYLGFKEFLPRGKILHLLSYECKLMNITEEICENFIFMLCGFDPVQFDMDYLPTVLNHVPAGSSTKTVIHYAQEIANKGNFQYFDYGKEENMVRYGSLTPPLYNSTNIPVPVYLMYSDNDSMANKIDVLKLASNLPNLAGTYEVPLKEFNHVDFLFAKDVVELVYKPLLKQLSKF
ncbi:lipase 3-like [Onthophagus taurus]|uniref:lipase 3-like n=1 Tax=Onthophagus taurus TaxID=166361 RepID=UPI0039BDDD84